MPPKLISCLGIFILVGLAWACSLNRKAFPWRTVLWGLGLQFAFAIMILKTELGEAVFDLAQRGIVRLISFADEGAKMVFGPLADNAVMGEKFGANRAFILAITVSTTIILVSSLSSLLYHWRILPKVVRAMAWVMQRALRTSGSESLAAAANIFMGQTEAPLLIKPYIAGMTRSELLALMVGGMATIAGGVGAVYVSLGVNAGHLLTASVMSAPAALMIAKIILPETEASETAATAPATAGSSATNSIDAVCLGAGEGLMLSLNVIAMLIAFVAIVALANHLLGSVWQWFQPQQPPLTLQIVAGWLNVPFAWLLGVPAKDGVLVGQILGERIILNEFLAYVDLMQQKSHLEPRSVTLATYALCGFANFGSVAIQIGGIGSLAPKRRGDLAQLGVLAMIGGLLASYLTAAIAGILLD